MAPHNVYPCRGGDWIAIAASDDAAWAALCAAMGRPELAAHPDFHSLAQRQANEVELDRLIAAWSEKRDARILETELQEAGIAAAKSANSLDLVTDEHLWARGFYRHVRDAEGNDRAVIGPAWRMSNAAAITDAAPRLGQHNAYVFGEIMGISEAAQRQLMEAGVIR
jgi:crotonobetainyl-CoA:carnitine CoA-transferase CaiB-like acyl-CoA transferase